jgi:hypothetical protein
MESEVLYYVFKNPFDKIILHQDGKESKNVATVK